MNGKKVPLQLKQHKIFGRYFRMLSMGVPLVGVIQKMKMDGLQHLVHMLNDHEACLAYTTLHPHPTASLNQFSASLQNVKLKNTVFSKSKHHNLPRGAKSMGATVSLDMLKSFRFKRTGSLASLMAKKKKNEVKKAVPIGLV